MMRVTAPLIALLLASTMPSASREWGTHCEAGRGDEPPLRGFSFYCDAELTPEKPIPPAPNNAPPPDSARAAVAAERARIEEALSRALMTPTHANVVSYMRLQRGILNKSSLFSDLWIRAVLTEPGLDYLAKRPLGTVPKRIYQAELRRERETFLSDINQTHDFLYVGKESCAICRAYGPVLRNMADRKGMTVLAVSADGSPLTGWPEAVRDEGQLARLGVSLWALPLTAVFDRATNQIQVIGYGFLAEEQIIENLHRLLALKPGEGI